MAPPPLARHHFVTLVARTTTTDGSPRDTRDAHIARVIHRARATIENDDDAHRTP